jgi:lipopolysaccharide biosynthesis protein
VSPLPDEPRRVAVFAHHDRDDVVDAYVLRYLEGLSDVVDRIVFVSDGLLPERETDKVRRFAAVVVSERHGEYDFGSYKRGVRILRENGWLETAGELVLCNDSCYGPVFPLRDVWDRKAGLDHDLHGITTSVHGYLRTESGYEPTDSDPHVQSYFMVLSRRLFSSDAFGSFLEGVEPLRDKREVVHRYELGLSRIVLEAGFRIGSHVGERVRFADTHGIFTRWKELLFEGGSPFLKVQAITLYNADFSCLHGLYPTSLIRRNLLRRLGWKGYLRAVHPRLHALVRLPLRLLGGSGRSGDG